MPNVALAIYLRDIEMRQVAILSVVLAGESPSQAYATSRKGQQLTTLEEKAFDHRAECQAKNYSALKSRSLTEFIKSRLGTRASASQRTCGRTHEQGLSP